VTEPGPTPDGSRSPATGGVQSVERTFDLLELLAEAGGGLGLSRLADASGLPLPTIHRLMRTLVNRGYVRQEQSRRYTLGPRLVRLGEVAGGLVGEWVRPHLAALVERTGETANLAVLDGDLVVYLAQVPGRHAMRMFTEPGRRLLPHGTGVGKAVLAQLPESRVRALLARTGMPPRTEHTITDVDAMIEQLAVIRRQGYAVDDGEQEIGVRCVAVPIPELPSPTSISVSGPAARITQEAVTRFVPALHEAAARIAADLARTDPAAG
jgi:IclR family acetate operon transcriptional repressor